MNKCRAYSASTKKNIKTDGGQPLILVLMGRGSADVQLGAVW